VRTGCNVSSVVSTEIAHAEYVCRKLKISELPCQDMTALGKYSQSLSSLEHPHICRFVEMFEDKTHIFMVYEKANPVTLFEHIRERSSLTEEDAADYLRQVAMALSVAHSQGIVHGRMSPRSLILSREEEDDEACGTQLKVCDMGQGWVVRPGILETEASTKSFEIETYALSPEVAGEDLTGCSDCSVPKGADKSDIWAVGVIFYHMLSGTTPFKVGSRADLAGQVGTREVCFQESMWAKLSLAARDAVQSMLRVIPGIRISAAQVLRHNWVKVARATFPRTRMVELLNNLRMNVNESEFKRFVLRVIAEQLPQDSRTAEIVERAFRCLDRNGDGVLTVQEIIKGLKKHLNLSDNDRELEQLFTQIDRDSSGTVNVQEFICASMSQKRSTCLPVLWEAFNAFDKDRSGSITFDEIDRIVKETEGALLGKEMVDSIAGEIRCELDRVCGKGKLDFDEFVCIMSNSKPNAADVLQKDAYRVLWGCGVDCYNVRHIQPATKWDLSANGPKSLRSAYRRKGSRKRSSDQMPVAAG